MIAALKILLIVAGGTYLALVLFVFFSQKGMVYLPSRDVSATPADSGLEYEEVWLTTRLGSKVHGWYVPCEGAELTVLFCHGNAGNISHRLETLSILHGLGVSTLIFDYSGYGKSGGKPSEKATEADARAAWDWLVARGASPDAIVVHGRSIGGAVAASLVHELSDEGMTPAGLILESTFTSMVDMGQRHYPWLPVRLLSLFRYDSMSKAESLQCPVLSLHSPTDEIVPYELGRVLYEACPGEKRFVVIHGGHNSGYLDSGEVYVGGLGEFFAGVGG